MLYDEYCHNDGSDEEHDCLDYMECEQCPYYYADLDDLEVQIMTIDEAIAHAKEKAKKKMAAYENHYDKDAHYYPRQCKRYAKQQEQLAEWLEELKELRNMTAGHLYAVAFNRGYLKAEKEVRNKAIDDFVKFANTMPTVETKDGEIRPMWLEEIAEKLKAGGENENGVD